MVVFSFCNATSAPTQRMNTDFLTKQIFYFLQDRLGALSDDGLTLNVRVAVLYGVAFLAWFVALLPVSHVISLALSRTYRGHSWTQRMGWLSWCLSVWHSPVAAIWALNGMSGVFLQTFVSLRRKNL